jgi:hypothetical protein
MYVNQSNNYKKYKKLELRTIQAGVPAKLVGKLSHSLCRKAFPQSLSERYTIHNLASLRGAVSKLI